MTRIGRPVRVKRFNTRVGTGESPVLLPIPFDLKRVFGKVRLPLWVTVNDYSYRTAVAVYKHRFFIPMLREQRDAASVTAGQRVNVQMALDGSMPPRDAGSRRRTSR